MHKGERLKRRVSVAIHTVTKVEADTSSTKMDSWDMSNRERGGGGRPSLELFGFLDLFFASFFLPIAAERRIVFREHPRKVNYCLPADACRREYMRLCTNKY